MTSRRRELPADWTRPGWAGDIEALMKLHHHHQNTGDVMAGAKIMVLYPTPRDAAAFERAYRDEHTPMVTRANFPGMTRFVATRITGTADGTPAPFARVAELHFPSLQALQAAAGSEGAKRAVAHAISISTGGAPVFLIAEEETTSF
jgi:uncharacterized protein (TIGR02118 family)